MRCPSCGNESTADARYCSQCGAPLQQQCPECQSRNAISAHTCMACGTQLDFEGFSDGGSLRLSADQARQLVRYMPRHLVAKILARRESVAGERKQATFLFADIVGSTALGERFDEEEFRAIMSGALQRMINPVYRYEGTVGQLRGDEVFALFGVPIVHEDDPERAVRAAFGIREGVREYGRTLVDKYGVEQFDLRVTLNTGDVVVGEIGGDLHAEYTAMGDAVNTAAKMQAVARPGTILISEETHRLVKQCVSARSRGAVALKGKRDPLELFEVTGICAAARRVRRAEGLTSSLVGRANEVKQLESCLRQLQAGEGQIVFLSGEAGLGKTRLVSELKRSAIGEAVSWMEGNCVSFGRSISYYPFADAIRNWLHIAEDDPPDAAREKVRLALDALFGDSGQPEESVRSMATLLSLDASAGDAAEAADPEDVRRAIEQTVQAVVRQMAGGQPLVLCIEDLHWADRASVELAQVILQCTQSEPVMLLCVTRSMHDGNIQQLGALAKKDYGDRVTEIVLSPLSSDAGKELLGNLLGAAAPPAQLQQGVLARAEGNPLFVEELLYTMIDRGSIVREGTQWKILRESLGTQIPRVLLGIISDRIDRLGDAPKSTLRAASVLGREFSLPVLEAMMPGDASRGIETCMEALEQAELVTELRRRPYREFRFRHDLIRQAAYDGLLADTRTQWHQQAGRALMSFYGEQASQHAGRLAHHFRLGSEWDPATKYLLIAARKARAVYSNLEAIELLSSALELAGQVEGERRNRYRYDILKERAAVLDLVGRTQEEAADLDHMARLCQEQGRASQTAEVCLLQSDFALRTGKLEQALRLAQRSKQLYEETNELPGQGRALGALGTALGRLGNLEESRDKMEEAFSIFAELDDRASEAAIRKGLGTAYARLGSLDQAVEHYGGALRLYRGLQNRRGESEILGNLGSLHYMRADYEEAIESFVQAQQLFHDLGNVRNEAKCTNNVGLSYAALGDYQKSLELHEQAGKLYKQVGDDASMANALSNLGIAQEALAVGGDPAFEARSLGEHPLLDEALSNHLQSLEIYENSGDQLGCVRAQFNIGCVKLTRGQIKEAMSGLSAALEIYRKHGLDALASRVLAAIARGCLLLDLCQEALERASEAASLIADTQAAEADEIHFLHFRALQSCGRPDDAKRELDMAVAATTRKADRIRGGAARDRFLAAYHRLLEAADAEAGSSRRP